MKAVVIHGPRDLRIEERPEMPLGDAQVRVEIQAGGICGSDLHYYQNGGFGAIRLKEPMILGHEVAGRIVETGAGAGDLQIGDLVAVSPSRPCYDCTYCNQGLFQHCLDMRFYGSAMPMPHIQGAFRQSLVADAGQCHRFTNDVGPELAAFAEPLSVVLHALKRAGSVAGKRVLVTGAGPIGALAVLAARAAGAREIIVTDVVDAVLETAGRIGADHTINVAEHPDWHQAYSADKGSIDLMFECSGNQAAFQDGLAVLRPQGTLVQLGLGGEIALPQNLLVSKEINLRGSFRFHEEFGDAVAMIDAGEIDLTPLLTARFPVDQAREAFELAGDRSRAMKVQLTFQDKGPAASGKA